MAVFNWLHLTDLHLGVSGSEDLWPNVEDDFFEDLRYLTNKVGSLDLVLFTGDFVQRGSLDEFERIELLLQRFWAKLRAMGSDPVFLAVPGNHDLMRPNNPQDPALIDLMCSWSNPDVQTPFWENPDSPQRKVVEGAFANYVEWWQNASLPKPEAYAEGMLPGDFSATLEKDGIKIGVLGLNTSFLQLTGGDFEGRLALHIRQFHKAVGGQGPDWVRNHDTCLLLTHHPPNWLTDEAQRTHLEGEIHSPSRRFAFHLFGHMHKPELRTVALGGADARRRLQGSSLFAVEGWGTERSGERIHGYSVGQLEIGVAAKVRIWPRRAHEKQEGGRQMDRDISFSLSRGEEATEWMPVTLLRSSARPPKGDDLSDKAQTNFALLKPVKALSPEDLNFQIVEPGVHPTQDKRPFFESAYVPRTAIPYDRRHEEHPHPQYDEKALVQSLRENRGLVLIGPPLVGKSHTLYEVVKRLDGYDVLKPDKKRGVPNDDDFFLLRGRRIILLLDDLTDYVDSELNLYEFSRRLGRHASAWAVACSCRDGSELGTVRKAAGTSLKRFYDDIPRKLSLLPLASEAKKQLTELIGKDWDPSEERFFGTPGSITMEEPMRYMRERFEDLSDNNFEQRDTLRALQLLAYAGILPFTHNRIQALLERIFERPSVHLGDCLEALTNQAFLHSGRRDPAQPEPAYLRNVVSYGKDVREDFPRLVEVLTELRDYEGLTYLGVTFGSRLQDVERALACFEEATSYEPGYAVAWFNKGVSLMQLERYPEAAMAYDKAVSYGYDAFETWHNKGLVLHQLGRYEEAIEAYDRALTLQPTFAEAWYGKGASLISLDRYQEALEAVDKALNLEADHTEAWRSKGAALRGLGRYQEALEAYDQSTQYGPDYFRAWLDKGAALEELGRYQEALEANERAISLRPDYPGAWYNKGVVLDKLGRYQEALEACNHALRLKPNFPEPWNKVGELLLNRGLYHEALEAFNRAIEYKANSAITWYNKGVTLAYIGDYEVAALAFEQALNYEPSFPGAWYNRGVALAELGRDQEALEAFERDIYYRPDNPNAWNNKGVALAKLGHHQEALMAFEQALLFKADFPEALAAKGVSLGKLDRIQEALEAFEQALYLRPEYPEVWHLKGGALFKLERREEAVEWLCRAWRARERLSDKGVGVARTLRNLNHAPEECE